MCGDMAKYTLASTVFQIVITSGVYNFSKLSQSYAYVPELTQIYWEHTHNQTMFASPNPPRNLLQARISYSHAPALGGSWEMIYIDMQMSRLHHHITCLQCMVCMQTILLDSSKCASIAIQLDDRGSCVRSIYGYIAESVEHKLHGCSTAQHSGDTLLMIHAAI